MDVKVTAVSFKDVCDLLLVCKQDHIAVEREDVRLFCERISSLDRGGYIVMLGLTPLEVMLAYKEIDYAIRYIDLLKLYETWLGDIGGHKAHRLLHTHYVPRGLYNELLEEAT